MTAPVGPKRFPVSVLEETEKLLGSDGLNVITANRSASEKKNAMENKYSRMLFLELLCSLLLDTGLSLGWSAVLRYWLAKPIVSEFCQGNKAGELTSAPRRICLVFCVVGCEVEACDWNPVGYLKKNEVF